MRRWCMGMTMLLLVVPQIRAGNLGAFMGGFPAGSMVGSNPSFSGGGFGMVGNPPAPPGSTLGGVGGGMVGLLPPPAGSTPGGFGGIGGMCGHIGFFGMSGCCGGMLTGIPCCSIGGCFGGCFGGFGTQSPMPTYSPWAASPRKAYYYRHLHLSNFPGIDVSFDFVLVHYPERPKHFYYFDPLAKSYVGRYIIGAKSEACYQLLSTNDRKADLKDIRESAFRSPALMPNLAHVIVPRSAALTSNTSWQNVKMPRPPDNIPDAFLGLPIEEDLRKLK